MPFWHGWLAHLHETNGNSYDMMKKTGRLRQKVEELDMEQFDVLIIGGGPGGYLCAERAAQNGLTAAVVEKRALGGTCLNEGCVPTKSLLYCAKQYAAAQHGADYGVHCENVRYDHAAVIERKNQVVKTLVSGVGYTMKSHKVKVYSGEAAGLRKVAHGFETTVNGEAVSGKHLVIATGSVAAVPPIPGVQEGLANGFVMTNREILELKTLPKTLVCIGGGVIGLEMACYFATVGVKVIVIEMMPKIAGNTDPEICNILMKTYAKLGMEFKLSAGVKAIGADSVTYEDAAGVHTVACDRVLLAAGRRANCGGLPLDELGIHTERGAIVTDEHLRTNVHGVYAIGDCNGKLMLAHTAYREAEVAVNHMLGKKDRIDYNVIPSVIYTTPEVACVGETEQSAKEKGMNVKVVKASMMMSGRYVAENRTGDGFCKIVYDLDRRCVAGVQIVGSYASEMIYGAAMMVYSKSPVQHLDKIVFPHPSVCETIREALFMI